MYGTEPIRKILPASALLVAVVIMRDGRGPSQLQNNKSSNSIRVTSKNSIEQSASSYNNAVM